MRYWYALCIRRLQRIAFYAPDHWRTSRVTRDLEINNIRPHHPGLPSQRARIHPSGPITKHPKHRLLCEVRPSGLPPRLPSQQAAASQTPAQAATTSSHQFGFTSQPPRCPPLPSALRPQTQDIYPSTSKPPVGFTVFQHLDHLLINSMFISFDSVCLRFLHIDLYPTIFIQQL